MENLDSKRGEARFQGGNLIAKATLDPETLTPEHFRLCPDSAGYQAGKDGKDLGADVDLVGPGAAYKRWKKTPAYQQWLRDTGQTRAETPKPEPKPFAVLGSKGVEVGKYDTLAEAVQGAKDGDTIEVRGNGPFVIKPITIHNTALTIRAGEGFRPVIKADPDEQGNKLLLTDAPLVLEGLEFQWVDARAFDPAGRNYCRLVVATGPASSLHVANCRFLMNRREGPHAGCNCIAAWDLPLCHLRNCQFLVGGRGSKVIGNALNYRSMPHSEVTLENCLNVGHLLHMPLTHAEPMKMVLKRNTFLGTPAAVHFALRKKIGPPPLGEKDPRPLQMETSANILQGHVQLSQHEVQLGKEKVLSAQEAEQFLTQMIGWRENRNLYLLPEERDLLHLYVVTPEGQYNWLPPTAPIKTLAEWKNFWGMADFDSERGEVRFEGGDLVAKANHTPEQLVPADFRLRADSAGYRAGKDGKDLGADVDLVGPGEAYERWKQTPEYQQWLRDTKQFGAEALKTEPQAFALLGARGIEVARYDTLAEAVQRSSDGDTIEVRGNGPFVSEPIQIARPLTIRASEGFRPVIKLSHEAAQRKLPLLNTNAALVLEGLELQRAPPEVPRSGGKEVVQVHQAPLRAAHCRFRGAIWANLSPVCVFCHCEFLADGIVAMRYRPGARVIFENCLHRTNGSALGLAYHDATLHDVSIHIKRGTLVSRFNSVWFPLQGPLPIPSDRPQASKPIRLEVTESIFDAPGLLGFGQDKNFLDRSAALEPPEAEATLLRLLDWQGERNIFAVGSTLVSWVVNAEQQSPRGPTTLEEWKQFWGAEEPDSAEGRLRFRGGDLRAHSEATLDRLTPEDFRLRADSDGYKAGKDGKDLGADVDLVGPGQAYQRWKKTPAYQQWLKDTGQSAD
jgi:hypothetical protein